jgi:hypothetical protein
MAWCSRCAPLCGSTALTAAHRPTRLVHAVMLPFTLIGLPLYSWLLGPHGSFARRTGERQRGAKARHATQLFDPRACRDSRGHQGRAACPLATLAAKGTRARAFSSSRSRASAACQAQGAADPVEPVSLWSLPSDVLGIDLEDMAVLRAALTVKRRSVIRRCTTGARVTVRPTQHGP